MFSGATLSLNSLSDGFVELRFDRQDLPINKFDKATLAELQHVLEMLTIDDSVRGVVVTSAKDSFVVGADITEFGEMFSQDMPDLIANIEHITFDIFNKLEDLPVPTVVAINGYCLGGGLEIALAGDFRIATPRSTIGLPETNLGIIQGFGGTIRMSRLVGVRTAIEWITKATNYPATEALSAGVIDAIVEPEQLLDEALVILEKAIAGEMDWQGAVAKKKSPLIAPENDPALFAELKDSVSKSFSHHYPALLTAVKCIEEGANLDRDGALKIEAKYFAQMGKTEVAKQLINVFLAEQAVAKIAKKYAKSSEPVSHSAVLGAGIMGGGIAYQSAYKGTPIIMKDINQAGIDLGVNEATQLLARLENQGRINADKKAKVLANISPTLTYDGFDKIDLVIEAVVENPKVKLAVLAEVEKEISDSTVLATNTSTISIDYLSENLARPENFLGMHFFNPVPKMPLVEVIKGTKTSDAAIAKTVNYALAMGKKPIVVKDCPGFLVNRVLFPYLGAFMQMVNEGIDFTTIDKVMEDFGWPMGPAYLCDVIGMDTTVHAADVLAEGFPDRMKYEFITAAEHLLAKDRLGQKNGVGFYSYPKDERGRAKKTEDSNAVSVLDEVVTGNCSYDENTICERLMVAFCLEAIRCLEENIVDSAVELDMAMLYGLGFPRFRGGPIRYVETLGIAEFVSIADKYAGYGNLYKVTDKLRAMAESGQTFYGE